MYFYVPIICQMCLLILGFRWMCLSLVNCLKRGPRHHSLCFKCFVLACGVLMNTGTTVSSLFSCWSLLKPPLFSRYINYYILSPNIIILYKKCVHWSPCREGNNIGLNTSHDATIKLWNIKWHPPSDTLLFSKFVIYICIFSFHPKKIVKFNRTEKFEQTNNILEPDRIIITLTFDSFEKRSFKTSGLV